jgi:hypothetical protein
LQEDYRMGLCLSAFLFALSAGPPAGPEAMTCLWTRLDSTQGANLMAKDLALDGRGNIFAAALPGDDYSHFRNNRNPERTDLSKFDAAGDRVWSNGLSGRSLALGKDGSLIVFGSTTDTTVTGKHKYWESDFCLGKYGADGKPAWTRVFGTDSLEQGTAVIFGESGNLYAAGSTLGSLAKQKTYGDYDVCVLKLDPEGKMLWARSWGSAGYDEALGLARGEGGTVWALGKFAGPLDGAAKAKTPFGYAILLDAEGKELKRIRIDAGPGPIGNVMQGADGDFYALGLTEPDAARGANLLSEIYVTKFTPDWKEVWTRHWNMPGEKRADAMACDRDGNLYVAGVADLKAQKLSRIFVLKYDRQGNLVFDFFRGTTLWDSVNKLALDPNGNLIMLGTTMGNLGESREQGQAKAFLIKYAPHAPPSYDCARAASLQEHLICEDARLSALDDTLAALYQIYVAQSRKPSLQKAEQAHWVRNIRATATTRDGLDSVLAARVFELRSKTEENIFRR